MTEKNMPPIMLPTAKLLPDSSALWVPVALTKLIKLNYFLKKEILKLECQIDQLNQIK